MITTVKSKEQMREESAQAVAAFQAAGNPIKTNTRKTATTITLDENGEHDFKESHRMSNPVYKDGRLRAGAALCLAMSTGITAEVSTLNRWFVTGTQLKISYISKLVNYHGLYTEVARRGRSRIVQLSPAGYDWLERMAPVILAKSNHQGFDPDLFLPKNMTGSTWLRDNLTPVFEQYVLKHQRKEILQEAGAKLYHIDIHKTNTTLSFKSLEEAQGVFAILVAGGGKPVLTTSV